jgi:branched-chain amino acid transport system permease protein
MNNYVATFTILVWGLIAVALGVAAPEFLSTGNLRLTSEILLVFTMAQMWNLLAGYAGLISLGQQAFIGIGAYAVYTVTGKLHASPYLGFVVAFLAAGLAATIVAPLLFRLRDAYFAIGTWVFAEIVRIVVTKSDWLGSSAGMAFQGLSGFGVKFSTACFWVALVLTAISIIVTQGMMRSRVGLALMALRDNELAAASSGIDVLRSRLIAFVLSAAVCGAAGSVYFAQTLFVDPTSAFDVNWVVILLFIVIVGGIGTNGGPVVGTIVYFGLRELFRNAEGWYLVLMGAIAFGTILMAPLGIWGQLSKRYGIGLLGIRRTLPTDLQQGSGAAPMRVANISRAHICTRYRDH